MGEDQKFKTKELDYDAEQRALDSTHHSAKESSELVDAAHKNFTQLRETIRKWK